MSPPSPRASPPSCGYRLLNKEAFLDHVLQSCGYRRVFPEKVLREWKDRNQWPVNDRLCEEAVWLTQNQLLGSRQDMEEIAAAIRKIQAQAPALRQA